ncbi:hypothetical protein OG912_32855 [Streptomyces sp. NBC_00464]|uniref:hypothetical protein n=1 Tax=unclassified Streptomyces TaxID=2593676 RepID=UPI002E138E00|nr:MULTISPECIES: hypothetical protein [unclassified Streptomyces]WSI61550.1 hypothetical protein OG471_05440 [Streptomyces sp. NBC_01336]
MDNTENAPAAPNTAGATPPTTVRDRTVDLIALLTLLMGSCAVFCIAGAEAFTVVTSVGMGLFSTWRARR